MLDDRDEAPPQLSDAVFAEDSIEPCFVVGDDRLARREKCESTSGRAIQFGSPVTRGVGRELQIALSNQVARELRGRLRRLYSRVASEAPRAKAAQRLHLHLVLSLPRLLLGLDRDRPFDIPTLLLSGDNDALIPPSALALPPHRADRVGVQIIPGGHFLVDENPADVARAILAHLGVHVSVA